MKRYLYLFLLGSSLCFSCENNENVELASENVVQNNIEEHKISVDEALSISNSFFKQTRNLGDYNIGYIVNKRGLETRNLFDSDTVAYIMNRENGKGFVVISADDRVFPVLAFSDEGQFTYEENEDDIVYSNFVSLLDDYIEKSSYSDTSYEVSEGFLDGCYSMEPSLITSWSQRMPYNKYVIQEHPGCPVGCVAVATGQVMTYCKKTLNYHGSKFYFSSIRNALLSNTNTDVASGETRIVGLDPVYSYGQAIDSIAKLLYWIGKDLRMSYSTTGSSASSYNARSFLLNKGYLVRSNYLLTYSDTLVAKYIHDGDLIYMRGTDTGGAGGHAWIIDGGYFCCDNLEAQQGYYNVYVHCDWGWGGSSNGYYSGNVFATTSYEYAGMSFFAVGKEE